MWPLKAHYTFWFGSLSGILPYTAIFARQHLDVSASAVGTLFFILPFVAFVAKPLICSLADHYNRHSLAMLLAQTMMIIGYGLLIVIPFIKEYISTTILWWVFCILILIANTAMGAGVSLADYLVINEVVQAQQAGKDVNYGNYRIWGTIGFGIFGVLSGVINDNSNHLPYLIPGLIMFVSIEFFDILCILKFYHRKHEKSPSEQPPISHPNEQTSIMGHDNVPPAASRDCWSSACSRLKSIGDVFVQVGRIFYHYPSLLQFCLIIFIFGILTAFHWTYFFWFIEDLRGKDPLLMGLCILVESFIGEIPIFYIAHRIIQKFGSVFSLCLALAAFALRYLAYGYWMQKDVDRYWDILLVEILQGLTFSLFYTVMTHLAQHYADKCDRIEQKGHQRIKIKPSATMQGLMSGCYEGIGLGTGSLIGGYIQVNFNLYTIWRVGAFLSIGLIIFNIIIETIKYFFFRKSTDLPSNA